MILKSMGVGAYVGEIWTGILMFADDIILLAETKNDLEMMINKTNTFLKERKLSLNPSKCNYIVFNHHKQNQNQIIKDSIKIENEIKW